MLIQMIAKAIYDDDTFNGEKELSTHPRINGFIDYLPDIQSEIYGRKTISWTIKY